MINEKTLQWNYYVKKLPLYLQNSYGFSEHFRNLFQIMLDTNRTATDLLRALDLTAPGYYANLDVSKNPEEPEVLISSVDYTYDLLDKMAALYNVNRYFDVDYVDISNQKIHASLKLNNGELLKLILVKVVQNNYLGTYEDIRKLYNLIELPIYIYNNELDSGNVYLIFDSRYEEAYTPNIKHMFFANLLSIKSLGIKYLFRSTEESNIGEWDSTLPEKFWDVGVWL